VMGLENFNLEGAWWNCKKTSNEYGKWF
jgi:hypothetical protein